MRVQAARKRHTRAKQAKAKAKKGTRALTLANGRVKKAEKNLKVARAKRAVVKAQEAPPPPKAKAVMTARRKGLHPMQKLRKEIRRAQGARA